MYYLHPKGHFLTGHISAPTVGLETRVVCLHFLQGLEENTNKTWCQSREWDWQIRSAPLCTSWAWPGRIAFYPFLCPWVFLWHYVRSISHEFHRLPLTSWVSLEHKVCLQPQGPVCHLQWSHQHPLQECNNSLGAHLPQPLLSPRGWEGGNCNRAFPGCQSVTS